MITIPEGEAPLSYLAYTLPPRPEDVGSGEVLDRFLEYVGLCGIALYPAQEEAILECIEGNNVILNTPTGSGKSLVATALHFSGFARGERSFYTAPVKALVNEKFFALCRDFGPKNVGLMTGDATVNRDAPIVCCTAEILANIGLREGSAFPLEHVVIDEFHYYADRDRGTAWQLPLLTLPQARFLLMSATFGDASAFQQKLTRLNGRSTAVVRSTERPVPLDYQYRETPLHETLLALIEEQRAPIYLVQFTQRACAEEAQNLMSTDYCTKAEKKAIAEALRGVRFDSPYGKSIQRFVRHGIGLHHAGLLPKYRLLVEKLAQRGHLKIVVGTDTLGVGVNIPIRTVVFSKLCKFDGAKVGLLRARDFHQIAGRAGRKGFDDRGSVVAQAPEHVIENLRLERKAAAEPSKKRKIVRKKPPDFGYVHWDRGVFERLMTSPPEPLASQFRVSHGMLVNVLQRGRGGCRAMARLIRDCHEPVRRKRALGREAAEVFLSLVAAGVLEVAPSGNVVFRADLQYDFSLHQALSLYLIETLELLDRNAESYSLDLLTLVESVLENPDIILRRQLDKLKTEKLAELKAAGVEYEQRMEELEKLEVPRPNADFIYNTFNEFARRHPWVKSDNIRPKSVAREMFEGFYTFADYVKDYGLERSEGLLLRYLSDVYRTLTQTVPSSARSVEVDDIMTYFGAMVCAVDSSLLDEWEKLTQVSPEAARVAVADSVLTTADLVDITKDRRGFEVLLRNTLFSVLRALSRGDFETALELFAPGDEPWTGARLGVALKPFFAEHGTIRLDPAARSPARTRVVVEQESYWTIEQTISDWEDHNDWILVCRVDIEGSRTEGKPIIVLERIDS
ncbi:MAG: DUF3516 domain-containing protein [Polyangiaceae bacterium]|nr:DUF3516 domain-containing protein [Polyangiaceae bacterium]